MVTNGVYEFYFVSGMNIIFNALRQHDTVTVILHVRLAINKIIRNEQSSSSGDSECGTVFCTFANFIIS